MPELPLVGDEFAGYRLLAVLGRGGMSAVYQAENPRLGNVIALKVLAPELAEDDVFRTRFLEESRIAAAMNHPHVIPIHDMGSNDGLLYIAMRYVTGTDLRQMLKKRGRLPAETAVFLLTQAARALDAAHRRGLVHRDVKPGNLLVERGNDDSDPYHLYLADFGITKPAIGHSGLTSSGQFLGTIDYVAPEQIRGLSVLGMADQYSLGCVLYECLTGRVPFEKDLDAAIIWAHVEEEPTRPTLLRPDLPPAIDEVFARVLAKQPGDRYQSCREFMTAARDTLGMAASESAVAGPLHPLPLPLLLPLRQPPGRVSPPVLFRSAGMPPLPSPLPGGYAELTHDPGPAARGLAADPVAAARDLAAASTVSPFQSRLPRFPQSAQSALEFDEYQGAPLGADAESDLLEARDEGGAGPEFAPADGFGDGEVPGTGVPGYLREDPWAPPRRPPGPGGRWAGLPPFGDGRRRRTWLIVAATFVLAVAAGAVGATLSRGIGGGGSPAALSPTSASSPSVSSSSMSSPSPATHASATPGMSVGATAQPTPNPATLAGVLTLANGSTAAKGLLPPSSCTAKSATLEVCAAPYAGITQATFQVYPSLTALYAAYQAEVRSLASGSFTENVKNCGSAAPSPYGEVSWNHQEVHSTSYTIAQMIAGQVSQVSAMGRMACILRGSSEDIVWTTDVGKMLGIAIGNGPHTSVWLWWAGVHHDIVFPGTIMCGSPVLMVGSPMVNALPCPTGSATMPMSAASPTASGTG